MTKSNQLTTKAKKTFCCRAHGAFAEWLATAGGSVAITTYTSGKLVFVSSVEGRLRFRTLRFPRPMGLSLVGKLLALAIQKQILLFRASAASAASASRYELQQQYVTGKLDAHDVAIGNRGVFFANTRYNCLARATHRCNFLRTWQPPFITDLVRQDRCHLNGLGLHRGQPAMATAFCASGHEGGWREANRFASGVLLDVRANRVVADGLCMPHSPRRHAGRWWLCNSGHGELCRFDPVQEKCEPICSLPGFTRGLCFVDNHALVGLSKIREKHILDAPPIPGQAANAHAGVALVDLNTGKQTGMLEFTRGGREVYEVVFLPGIHNPTLIGYEDDKA